MTRHPLLDDPAYGPIIRRAVDALVGETGLRMVGAQMAEAVALKAVADARSFARREAHRELRSTAEAAAELGVTPRRVQALARKRGLGTMLGRERVFLPADLDALRARGPRGGGRPRKEIARDSQNGPPTP